MHPLSTAFAALTLWAALLLPSGVGNPAVGDFPAGFSTSSIGSTAATPTDSTTPPGPVDPGTGETPAAKETRVDYAPYVVAAVLILAVAAAALAWRRWGGPSSKAVRRGDQPTNQQGKSDGRGTGR